MKTGLPATSTFGRRTHRTKPFLRDRTEHLLFREPLIRRRKHGECCGNLLRVLQFLVRLLRLGLCLCGINQRGIAGQLHLGIDQEIPADRHLLAGRHSAANHDFVRQPWPQSHRADLEATRFRFDINETVITCHQHSTARDHHDFLAGKRLRGKAVFGGRNKVNSTDRARSGMIDDHVWMARTDPFVRQFGIVDQFMLRST